MIYLCRTSQTPGLSTFCRTSASVDKIWISASSEQGLGALETASMSSHHQWSVTLLAIGTTCQTDIDHHSGTR